MLVNVWFSIEGEWQSTEGTREKTLLETFSLPPPFLSSSEQWASCTQSFRRNIWNWDFPSPEASFQKVPLLHSGQPLWCARDKDAVAAPSQPIPEAETEADFTAYSTSNFISFLWVTRFRICSLCKTAFVLQPAFWRGLGQCSVFVVQEFSHWISYSTQGCCKWRFLNFTFLSKRVLRYLIRKQTI